MAEPRPAWKTWRARALLLVAGLAAAFLSGEALLRWVFHAAPLLDLDIYYLDSAGNLRMKPGARRRHVTRQWDVRIAINQEGFRDRTQAVGSPVSPVLGLGDSMAFGWGVNLEETFYYQLEERLNQKRPIRVVKAGTPGTGPGDQLRFLRTIGDQYRPQLVVLGFFVGNDFTDVQMGGLEQFHVEDGLLIRRAPRPASGLAAWGQKLLRSSHQLQFLRALQLAREARRQAAAKGVHAALAARDPWLLEFAKVHLREHPPEVARAVTETLGYLDQFRDYCRERNIDFVLMVIPRSYQIYPEELQELQSAFGLAPQDLEVDHPQQVLRQWGERRGVALLDLLDAFRDQQQRQPGQKLYNYPDAHMNAAGHKLAGERLAAFLEQRGLPRLP